MVGATDEQSLPTFHPWKPSWLIGRAVAASAVIPHKPAAIQHGSSANLLQTLGSAEFATKAGFEDVEKH